MDPRALFEEVARRSPPFSAVLQEHLEINEELLPHVLMGDLVRYVGAHLIGGGSTAPENAQELQAILAVLDEGLAGNNAETASVVAISFVEYLDTEPFFIHLEPYLGNAVRRELARQQRQASRSEPSR